MPQATLMTNSKKIPPQQEQPEVVAHIISTYGRRILIAFVILAVGILIIYNFTFRHTVNAENDYISAQVKFNQFESSGNASLASLAELQLLLTSHADLQAKYDALIAQNLLIRDEVELAIPYAERTFERTHQELHSLYNIYAKASLLIAEHNYTQALAMTQQLDADLKLIDSGMNQKERTLFLYNLLRLALLFETLDNSNDKETAWSAVQEALQAPENKLASLQINEVFREGRLSLAEFIEAKLSSSGSLH